MINIDLGVNLFGRDTSKQIHSWHATFMNCAGQITSSSHMSCFKIRGVPQNIGIDTVVIIFISNGYTKTKKKAHHLKIVISTVLQDISKTPHIRCNSTLQHRTSITGTKH